MDHYLDVDMDSGDESDTSSADGRSLMSVSVQASSVTSVDGDTPPPSIMSINSCIRASVFRNEFGRNLNNYSEIYRLPADIDEFERLGA